MTKNVLLSIKPKYVEKILNNEKKFEFRKKIFKQEVQKVYIYSSSPVQRVVAYFDYKGYIEGSPSEIWKKCNKKGGILKEEFEKYFEGKEKAYAICIDSVELLNDIDPKKKIEKFTAPQSYRYIEKEVFGE